MKKNKMFAFGFLKCLFALCFMFMVVCFGDSSVKAVINYGITDNGIRYEICDDGTVSIYDYDGNEETVVIPSEIDGKPVKEVGGMRDLEFKHLIIEEGIVEILKSSFQGCEKLETVSLPEGITVLNTSVFAGCARLVSINIPSTLKTIGTASFANCWKLKNVVIPEGVTSIGDDAFCAVTAYDDVLNIIIPDSVTHIGKDVFYTQNNAPVIIHANPGSYAKAYAAQYDNMKFVCISHDNIAISNAVSPDCTKNGKTSGSYCSDCGTVIKPQNIIAASGHSWDGGKITQKPTAAQTGVKEFFCKVCGEAKKEFIPKNPIPKKGKSVSKNSDSYVITKSGIKNGTVEYAETKPSKTSITVPNVVNIDGINYKVTSIAKNAFKNNKKVKKITIGSNVAQISANAFNGCRNLKTITVKSKTIKSVGKNAFKGIKSNAKIKVPSIKFEKYKKLFSGKGQKPTVKIIK